MFRMAVQSHKNVITLFSFEHVIWHQFFDRFLVDFGAIYVYNVIKSRWKSNPNRAQIGPKSASEEVFEHSFMETVSEAQDPQNSRFLTKNFFAKTKNE